MAWLPCTGPTLGAILTAASTKDDVGQGGILLAFYALGLAVPFILSALAFSSVSGLFRFFRDHYTAITVVSGVVLVAMGVLLYSNELTRLLQQPVTNRATPGSGSGAPRWPPGCASPRRWARPTRAASAWCVRCAA